MAEARCKKIDLDTVTTGTITQLAGGGTFEQVSCVKIGNIVIAGARIYNASVSPASYNGIFRLPEGFRPPVEVACSGYVYYQGYAQGALVKVKPNGEVGYQFTTSKVNQVGFAAVFPV